MYENHNFYLKDIQVLCGLITDCEVIAKDPGLSPGERRKLRSDIQDWTLSVMSGALSQEEIYQMIDEVCDTLILLNKRVHHLNAQVAEGAAPPHVKDLLFGAEVRLNDSFGMVDLTISLDDVLGSGDDLDPTNLSSTE